MTIRRLARGRALAISKLNHPGVSTVHDVGIDEATDYLVMELVSGVSLDERVQNGPASSEGGPTRAERAADRITCGNACRT